MEKTPINILKRNSMAVSGYQTAQKFAYKGTKQQAQE